MDGKIKLIPYDKHTNNEYRDFVIKDSLFLGFFYKGKATKENPFGNICGINECDKVDVLSELKNIVCVCDEDNYVNIVFSTNNRLVLICEDIDFLSMKCNELIVSYMNDYINVNADVFDESAWVKMVNRIQYILQTPFFIAFTEDIVSVVFDYITDTFVKLSIKGTTDCEIKLEDIINAPLDVPDKFSFIPEGNIIITNEDYFKNFSKYMCVKKQEEIGTELYYFDNFKEDDHFLNLYATIYNFVVNTDVELITEKGFIAKKLPNMELLFGIVIIKSLNK